MGSPPFFIGKIRKKELEIRRKFMEAAFYIIKAIQPVLLRPGTRGPFAFRPGNKDSCGRLWKSLYESSHKGKRISIFLYLVNLEPLWGIGLPV